MILEQTHAVAAPFVPVVLTGAVPVAVAVVVLVVRPVVVASSFGFTLSSTNDVKIFKAVSCFSCKNTEA